MRRTTLILLLLLFATLPAGAIPPPSYGVTLGGTTTSNLFQDSLSLGDRFTGLTLDLDQNLSRNLLVYYTGRAEFFSEYSDFQNARHTGGLEIGEYVGMNGEYWAVLEGESFSYGEEYSDYNRRAGNVRAGWGWVATPTLRLRGDLTTGLTRYPNADTSAVDVNDFVFTTGVNVSLIWPLSIDLEFGGSSRQYIELPGDVSAEAVWGVLRLSHPLTVTTGVVLSGTVRNQLTVGDDGLLALYTSGIDPGDLLWDGWRAGVDLNHRSGPWRGGLSLKTSQESYVETQALTGRGRREDRTVRTVVSLRRSFATGSSLHAPVAAVGVAWLWVSSNSTDSFYTWSGNSLMLTFMLLSR